MAARCEPGPFTRLLHSSGLLGDFRKADEDGGGGAVESHGEGESHPRPQHSGPYIGPRGGKWADPEHTLPWKEGTSSAPEQDRTVARSEFTIDAAMGRERRRVLPPPTIARGDEILAAAPDLKPWMNVDQASEAIGALDVEVGVAWGSDGKQRARWTSGLKSELSILGVEADLRDGTWMHNHPSGSPPSVADLGIAMDHDVAELVIVRKDGGGYNISRPKEGWPPVGATRTLFLSVVRAELAVAHVRWCAEQKKKGRDALELLRYSAEARLSWAESLMKAVQDTLLESKWPTSIRSSDHAKGPASEVRRDSRDEVRDRARGEYAHRGVGGTTSSAARAVAEGRSGVRGDQEEEGPLTRLARRLFERKKDASDVEKATASADIPSPLTFTALLEQLRANAQGAPPEPLADAARSGPSHSPSDISTPAARTRQHVPHSAHPVKVGPPPEPNRAEYPFVGTIEFQGLIVDVENKKGTYRSGKNADGTAWRVKMLAHYGEIRGTEGTDGDPLDAYVGDNADSSLVVVVHQRDPETKEYDEDKVMLGFDSAEDAVRLYRRQYDRPGFYESHTTMPIGQLWRWARDERNHGRKVVKKGRTMSDNVISLQTWADQVLQKGKTSVEDAVIEAEIRNVLRRHLRWGDDSPSPEACARRCADEVTTQYAMLDATKAMIASYLDRRGPDGLYVQALVSYPTMVAEVQAAREAMAARAMTETHGPQSAYAVNGY